MIAPLIASIGCMESLVHYKQLLLQRHRSEVNSKEVIGDCSRLLRELRSVDPDRRARYAELGEYRCSHDGDARRI